jgi:predicted SnoaL-like aldol condensation-catalyzing enzyme
MKIYIIGLFMAFSLVVQANNNLVNIEVQVMKTNKNKVIELLNSIQSGSSEAVGYINPNKYIQHNLTVADGLVGFGELMKQVPKNSAKVDVIRAFEDGNYIFTHTKYNFFGLKAGFDIFRFEDGKIIEHWDNLQNIVEKTASGRTQFDGTSEIVDINKTEANKLLIKNFIEDILMGKNPQKITDYISTKIYLQHNPHVKDGLSGLGEA